MVADGFSRRDQKRTLKGAATKFDFLNNLKEMRVKIKAKFFAMPKDYQGEREIDMEVSENFDEALEEIDSKTKIGIKDKLNKRFVVLINGRNYRKVLEDKGKLEEGDNLAFVPFLGGG